MGYETELLVGKDTGTVYKGKAYFMVYATMDLRTLVNSALFELKTVNNTPDVKQWEWYAPTGNDNIPVHTDPYGSKPRPVPIQDVIAALEKDMEHSDYRRLKWAHAMLKSMHEDAYEQLSVLLYGH